MMSNRFVAAAEAAALETAAVLPRRALCNINPNFDEIDSVFNDESGASKKVVKTKKTTPNTNTAAALSMATANTKTKLETNATKGRDASGDDVCSIENVRDAIGGDVCSIENVNGRESKMNSMTKASLATANAEFMDMPTTAMTTVASDDGGEVEDLIEIIVNGLAVTLEELANPNENMQHVSSMLEQGFVMAGQRRVELLQAICGELGLVCHSGLNDFIAIVVSRNEPCVNQSFSQEVYIILSLIDIKENDKWSRNIIRQCDDSNEIERLYIDYQAKMPDATSQEIMYAVKLHRSRHRRQQTVGSEVGQDIEEETLRLVKEAMVDVDKQLEGLEEDQEDNARSPNEKEDVVMPPGTFVFGSTSALYGHDDSKDRVQEQAVDDLIYLTCRHTYMCGVLFNAVDFCLRLTNATKLVVVISSYSVSDNLGPLISKNAPQKGWADGKPCFAMGMNMPLVKVLEDSGRSVISVDLIEGSHQAGAFDNGLPPHLTLTSTAYARQIVELANRGNVEIIGQGKLVNDFLKGAIKACQCESTIKYTALAHPTNMSANFAGNRKALAYAGAMNRIFSQIRGKINWAGLVLDNGLRSDNIMEKEASFHLLLVIVRLRLVPKL